MLFRRSFDFYINASIHVALAVCMLVFITIEEFDLNWSYELVGFVFFGTLSGYNFVKYAKVAGLHHRSLTKSLRAIQVLSFLCAAAFVYCAFYVPSDVIYVAVFFGGLTFLYAVPVVFKRNLRNFTGLKIFVVAMVWAGATVLIPWAYSDVQLTSDVLLSFTQRFLIVLVYTLPFEIRDLPYDMPSLRTLPQQFGIKKVKIIGVILLILGMLLEGFKDDLNLPNAISLGLLSILVSALIMVSSTNRSRYFTSFWVEAVPFFWWGVLLLMTYYLL